MNDSLIEPNFQEPFDTWSRDKSPQANASMLKTLDPVIDKAVQTFAGRKDPLLKSRARRITVDALGTYDPQRGRLQTHIFNQLRTLQRAAGQQAHIIKVPERIMLDRRTMARLQQELEDELGRMPTDAELTQRTGFSLKRLRRIREYSPAMSEGFFAGMGEGGFSPGVNRPESEAWIQFVYDDLSPTDQKIMEWTLGLHGQPTMSNQDIAQKLKRTPGAISQRKKMIQDLLNQERELSPFG
jgi:DNA-directed RNA polymerase specialized sigma subunit